MRGGQQQYVNYELYGQLGACALQGKTVLQAQHTLLSWALNFEAECDIDPGRHKT